MRKIDCIVRGGVLAVAVVVAAVGGAVGLSSCGGDRKNPNREMARSLYERERALTMHTLKRLQAAKDSATVNRIVVEYDKEMTKLNFSYPVDSDWDISESENDTMQRLIGEYVHLRDSLLKRFGGLDSLGRDTTPLFIPWRLPDSIAPKQ